MRDVISIQCPRSRREWKSNKNGVQSEMEWQYLMIKVNNDVYYIHHSRSIREWKSNKGEIKNGVQFEKE